MPLYVGWNLAILVFPPGITQENQFKPPTLDLPWRGGASTPLLSFGEVLALDCSHPCTVT
jgi:hypothetical protein